jgi:hypothetical protein
MLDVTNVDDYMDRRTRARAVIDSVTSAKSWSHPLAVQLR